VFVSIDASRMRISASEVPGGSPPMPHPASVKAAKKDPSACLGVCMTHVQCTPRAEQYRHKSRVIFAAGATRRCGLRDTISGLSIAIYKLLGSARR
jgi:hypothetical protein